MEKMSKLKIASTVLTIAGFGIGWVSGLISNKMQSNEIRDAVKKELSQQQNNA